MITVMLLLLRPALLYADAHDRRFVIVAGVVFFIDMLVAHSTWAVIFGWPERNEWTISSTLERICSDPNHPRHILALAIAREINLLSPTRNHVKSANVSGVRNG